jgi:hypothetical protein
MSSFADTVTGSLREGYTSPALVARWLFYLCDTYEVVNSLPAALMDEADSVVQNAQEGVDLLWTGFGLELFINLRDNINLLRRDPPQPEGAPPAKRRRMA